MESSKTDTLDYKKEISQIQNEDIKKSKNSVLHTNGIFNRLRSKRLINMNQKRIELGEKQKKEDKVATEDSNFHGAGKGDEILNKCDDKNIEYSEKDVALSLSSENISEKDYIEIPGEDLKGTVCTRIVVIGDHFLSSYHEFWPTDSEIQPYFLFKNKLSIDEICFKFQEHPFLKNSKKIILLFVLGLHDFVQYGTHINESCKEGHRNIQYIEELKSIKGYAKKLLDVKEKYSNENLSVLFSYFPSLHNVRLLKDIFNWSKDDSLDCGCLVNDVDCVAEKFIKSDFFAITQIYQRYMTTVQINVVRDHGVFEYIPPAISFLNGEWKLAMDRKETEKNIAVLNHVLNEFVFDIDVTDESKTANIREELSLMRNLIVKKNFRIALIGDKWIASVAYQWPGSYPVNPFFYFQDNFMFRDLRKAILTLVKGDEFATVIVSIPAGEFFTMRSSKCEGHKSLEYPAPNEIILKNPIDFAYQLIEKMNTLLEEIKHLRKNCFIVFMNCYPAQLASYYQYLAEVHSQTADESACMNSSLSVDVNFSEFDTKLSQCFDIINQYIQAAYEVQKYPLCNISQVVNSFNEKFIFPTYIEDICPSTNLARELFNHLKLFVRIFNRTSSDKIICTTLADQYLRKLKMTEMRKSNKGTSKMKEKRSKGKKLENHWSLPDSDMESKDSVSESIPSSVCHPTVDAQRSVAILGNLPSSNIQSKEPSSIISDSQKIKLASDEDSQSSNYQSFDRSSSPSRDCPSVDVLRSLALLGDRSSFNVPSEPRNIIGDSQKSMQISDEDTKISSKNRLSLDVLRSLAAVGDRPTAMAHEKDGKPTTASIEGNNDSNCDNTGLCKNENSHLALENTPANISVLNQKTDNLAVDKDVCYNHKNASSNNTMHLPKDILKFRTPLDDCQITTVKVMESDRAANRAQSDISDIDSAGKSRNEANCLAEDRSADLAVSELLAGQQSVNPTEDSVTVASDEALSKKEVENDNGYSLSTDDLRSQDTFDDCIIRDDIIKETATVSCIQRKGASIIELRDGGQANNSLVFAEDSLANEVDLIAELLNSNSLPVLTLEGAKNREGIKRKKEENISTTLCTNVGMNDLLQPHSLSLSVTCNNETNQDSIPKNFRNQTSLDNHSQNPSVKKPRMELNDSVSKFTTSSEDRPSSNTLRSLAMLGDRPSFNVQSEPCKIISDSQKSMQVSDEISKTSSDPSLNRFTLSSRDLPTFDILSGPAFHRSMYVKDSVSNEYKLITQLSDLNSLPIVNLESTKKRPGIKKKILSACHAGLNDCPQPPVNQVSAKKIQGVKRKKKNSSGCTILGADRAGLNNNPIKPPANNQETAKNIHVIKKKKKKKVKSSGCTLLSTNLAGFKPPPPVNNKENVKITKIIKKKRKINNSKCTMIGTGHAGLNNQPKPPVNNQESTKNIQVIKKKKMVNSSGCNTVLVAGHAGLNDRPRPLVNNEKSNKMQVIKKKKTVNSSRCTISGVGQTGLINDPLKPAVNNQENVKKIHVIEEKKKVNISECTMLSTELAGRSDPSKPKNIQVIKKKKTVNSSGYTISGVGQAGLINDPLRPAVNNQENVKKIQVIKKINNRECTMLSAKIAGLSDPSKPLVNQKKAKKIQIIKKKKKINSSGSTMLKVKLVGLNDSKPSINNQESTKNIQVIKKKKMVNSSGCNTILVAGHAGLSDRPRPPVNNEKSDKMQVIKKKKTVNSSGCTISGVDQAGLISDPLKPAVNNQENVKQIQVIKKMKKINSSACIIRAKLAELSIPLAPINNQKSSINMQVLKKKKKINSSGNIKLNGKLAVLISAKPPVNNQENAKKIQVIKKKKKIDSSGRTMLSAKLAKLNDPSKLSVKKQESAKNIQVTKKKKKANNSENIVLNVKHAGPNICPKLPINNQESAKKIQGIKKKKKIKSSGYTVLCAGHTELNDSPKLFPQVGNQVTCDGEATMNAVQNDFRNQTFPSGYHYQGSSSKKFRMESKNTVSEPFPSSDGRPSMHVLRSLALLGDRPSFDIQSKEPSKKTSDSQKREHASDKNSKTSSKSDPSLDCHPSLATKRPTAMRQTKASMRGCRKLRSDANKKVATEALIQSNSASVVGLNRGHADHPLVFVEDSLAKEVNLIAELLNSNSLPVTNLQRAKDKEEIKRIKKGNCSGSTMLHANAELNNPSKPLQPVSNNQMIRDDKANQDSVSLDYFRNQTSSLDSHWQDYFIKRPCIESKDSVSKFTSSSEGRPSTDILRSIAMLGDRPSFNVQSKEPSKKINGPQKIQQVGDEDSLSNCSSLDGSANLSEDRPPSHILSLAVFGDRPSFNIQSEEPSKIICSSQNSKPAGGSISTTSFLDEQSVDTSENYVIAISDDDNDDINHCQVSSNKSPGMELKDSMFKSSTLSRDRPSGDALKSFAMLGDRPSFNVQSKEPSKLISSPQKSKQADDEDSQSNGLPLFKSSTLSRDRPSGDALKSLAMLGDRPSFNVQSKEPSKLISSPQKSKQADDEDSQSNGLPLLDGSSSSSGDRPSINVLRSLAMLGDRPSFNVQSKEPSKKISDSQKIRQAGDEDSQPRCPSLDRFATLSEDHPPSNNLRTLAALGDLPTAMAHEKDDKSTTAIVEFSRDSDYKNALFSNSANLHSDFRTTRTNIPKFYRKKKERKVGKVSWYKRESDSPPKDRRSKKTDIVPEKGNFQLSNDGSYNDRHLTNRQLQDSQIDSAELLNGPMMANVQDYSNNQISSAQFLNDQLVSFSARGDRQMTDVHGYGDPQMPSVQFYDQLTNVQSRGDRQMTNLEGYSDHRIADAQIQSDQMAIVPASVNFQLSNVQSYNNHHMTSMQWPNDQLTNVQAQSDSQVANVQGYSDHQMNIFQLLGHLASIQSQDESQTASVQRCSDYQMISELLKSSQLNFQARSDRPVDNLQGHSDNQIANTQLQGDQMIIVPAPDNFQLSNVQNYNDCHITSMQLQSNQLPYFQARGDPQVANVSDYGDCQTSAQLQSDQLARVPTQGNCQMIDVQSYNNPQVNSAQLQSYQLASVQARNNREMTSTLGHDDSQITNVPLQHFNAASDCNQRVNEAVHSLSNPDPAGKNLLSQVYQVMPTTQINNPDNIPASSKRNREFYNELSKALMNNNPDVQDLVSIVHNIVSDYKSKKAKGPCATQYTLNANDGTSHQALPGNRNLNYALGSRVILDDNQVINASVQSEMSGVVSSGYLGNKEAFFRANQTLPLPAGDIHRSAVVGNYTSEGHLNDFNVVSSNIQMNRQGIIEGIPHLQPVNPTGNDRILVAGSQQTTRTNVRNWDTKAEMNRWGDYTGKSTQAPPEVRSSNAILQSPASIGDRGDEKLNYPLRSHVLMNDYQMINANVQSETSGIVSSGYLNNKKPYFEAIQTLETDYENPKTLSSSKKSHANLKDSVPISASSSGVRQSDDILRSFAMLGDRPSINFQSKEPSKLISDPQKSKQVGDKDLQSNGHPASDGSAYISGDRPSTDVLRSLAMLGDRPSFNIQPKKSSKVICDSQNSKPADDHSSVPISATSSGVRQSDDILRSLAMLGDRPSINFQSKEPSKLISDPQKSKQVGDEDLQSNGHPASDGSAYISGDRPSTDVLRSLAMLGDRPSFNIQPKKSSKVICDSQNSKPADDHSSVPISATSSGVRQSDDILRSLAMLGDRPSINFQSKEPSKLISDPQKSKQVGDKDLQSNGHPASDGSAYISGDRPSTDVLRSLAMLGDRPSFNIQPKKSSKVICDSQNSKPADDLSSDILFLDERSVDTKEISVIVISDDDDDISHYQSSSSKKPRMESKTYVPKSFTLSRDRPSSDALRSFAMLGDRPSFNVQSKEPSKKISGSQKIQQAGDEDSQSNGRPSLDGSSSSSGDRPSINVLRSLAMLGDRPSFNVQSKDPSKKISGSQNSKPAGGPISSNSFSDEQSVGSSGYSATAISEDDNDDFSHWQGSSNKRPRMESKDSVYKSFTLSGDRLSDDAVRSFAMLDDRPSFNIQREPSKKNDSQKIQQADDEDLQSRCSSLDGSATLSESRPPSHLLRSLAMLGDRPSFNVQSNELSNIRSGSQNSNQAGDEDSRTSSNGRPSLYGSVSSSRDRPSSDILRSPAIGSTVVGGLTSKDQLNDYSVISSNIQMNERSNTECRQRIAEGIMHSQAVSETDIDHGLIAAAGNSQTSSANVKNRDVRTRKSRWERDYSGEPTQASSEDRPPVAILKSLASVGDRKNKKLQDPSAITWILK